MKEKNRKILIAVTIILLLAFASLVVYREANAVIQSKKTISDESFFSDNKCTCLERNRNKCSDGYELKQNLCVNQTLKTYTNVLKGCTKYECNTTFYTFNSKNNGWEY